MQNKNVYLIIGIIVLICAIVGISYAYWQLTLQQSGINVVTTDCFNITFVDSNDINLQKAYPITDSEGSSLAPYTFTIENTCDSPASYQINLETMGQEGSVKVLPEEYLKANLIEKDSSNISTNNLTSDYEVGTTIDGAIKAYKLDTGIIQGKTSKTFELRLWLDYDTPVIDEVMNATYNGKISIISSYREAPSNMIMAGAFSTSSFSQYRSNIQTIAFEDTLSPKENATYTYDISASQDGSVMAYLVDNETSGYDMYIQSNGKAYANYDSSSLFANFDNLIEINNLQNLDTSYTIDMSRMFDWTLSLTNLDLSSFDTSNVTNMSSMFYNTPLTTLDLSSFDTSNVTDMSWMFSSTDLTELDLSHFDTSNVTDMSYMFNWTLSLTNLNLSSFDTSNVTNMSSMFSSTDLTTLDLSSFDTSNVTNMSEMFYRMSSLTTLDLSSFDTSNVKDMSSMFYDVSSLTKLDLSGFDTSNVTDMSSMFSRMESLIELDLSSFDTSNVANMSSMFYFAYGLNTIIYGNNFVYANTASVSNMFYDCPANKPTDPSWDGVL